MIWLLANWKPIAVLGAILATFYAGWHTHSWYDAYHNQKAEIKAVDSLGKGEAAIIDTNQVINKDVSLAKDDCASKPIPASIVRVLH